MEKKKTIVINENTLTKIVTEVTRRMLAEGFVPIDGIPGDVYEIKLWIENTRELMDRVHAIAGALLKKKNRGIELSEDLLANSSVVGQLVTAALNDYKRNFGDFSLARENYPILKKEVAKLIMDDVEEQEINNSNNNPVNDDVINSLAESCVRSLLNKHRRNNKQ